mmetsp:Transcript_1351/g.2212  ORF Transcript_1351/g.2212 Transcript_1351/m.2212 type:complete len:89 (+) Transcript_1351:302-568(+)
MTATESRCEYTSNNVVSGKQGLLLNGDDLISATEIRDGFTVDDLAVVKEEENWMGLYDRAYGTVILARRNSQGELVGETFNDTSVGSF